MRTFPTSVPQSAEQGGTVVAGAALPTWALRTKLVSLSRDQWAVLVLTVAALAGITNYFHFLRAPETLWWSTYHDRNAHFLLALEFSNDLKSLDIVHFLRDFDSARVWGPLNALVQGSVMAFAGPRYEWAILPSIACWSLSAWLAFLLARRLAHQNGVAAGLTATIFVLASPAHRAFASDIMIEAPGACLTLAALYCAVRAYQQPSVASVRWLGVSLTALFALKFNYWLLVCFALIANVTVARHRKWISGSRALSTFDIRSVLRAELRRPLNWAILLVTMLCVMVMLSGGGVFQIAGQRVSIRNSHNLVHIAYILLFLRAVLWWRGGGRQWIAARVENAPKQIIFWHLLPVAIWFLLPKRLGYFLWYVGPNHGEQQQGNYLAGCLNYFQWLIHDYHAGEVAFCFILAAGFLGLLMRKHVAPSVNILLWFLLISAALTAQHSNQKSRFLHSWAPGLWVLGGVGLAGAISALTTSPRARSCLASAAVVGVLAANVSFGDATPYFGDGGPRSDFPSSLELSEAYLPALQKSDYPTILSNMPQKQFSCWTHLAQYGRKGNVAIEMKADVGGGSDRERIVAWLETTPSDTIVMIDYEDVPEVFAHFVPGGYSQLPLALENHPRFVKARRWEFPQHRCAITLWTRVPDVYAIASSNRQNSSASRGQKATAR